MSHNKALLDAVQSGDVSKVRELILKRGARSINRSIDSNGWTLLHYSCQGGNLYMVRMLVSGFKADVDCGIYASPLYTALGSGQDEVAVALISEFSCNTLDGTRAMTDACRCDCVGAVRALVHKHGLHLVSQASPLYDIWINENTSDPLIVAVLFGAEKVMSYLIDEFGRDANEHYFGLSLLNIACRNGHCHLVKTLVVKYKCDVNALDHDHLNIKYTTPLHVAVYWGRKEIISFLLNNEFGCDVNALDDAHNTPLIVAALEGRKEVTSLLLNGDFGCDVNMKGSLGQSFLHIACQKGYVDLLNTAMLKCKVDINAKDDNNNTPLIVAALEGRKEVASLLLNGDFGCDVNMKGHLGRSFLHIACQKGYVDLLNTAMLKCKADINAQDRHKNTPLIVAALEGRKEVASLLLNGDFGCDVNMKGSLGQSFLHIACQKGYVDLLNTAMLKYKADINAQDWYHNTPLIVAALEGRKEVASLLLNGDFGCDVNMKGSLGQSFLHIACQKGYVDLLNTAMLKCKVDINAKDDNNNTPLHLAALKGNEEVFTCDFGCSVNVNTRGSKGRSVLHIACERGHTNLIHTLLEKHNADINAVDDKNDTPLHVAARFGTETPVIALISKFGCDVNARGNLGRSVLHLACLSGNSSLVSWLAKHISPLVVDDNGDTPLHICIKSSTRWDCMEALLKFNAPVMVRNKFGVTPRDIARSLPWLSEKLEGYIKQNRHKIYAHYDAIQKHAKQKYSSADRISRMFVIGNPGAGKSSLIETLKREGVLASFRKVSSSSVPLHTAGIVPTIHISKICGRILFYDFAGDAEYYSSHAAILENIASSRKGDNIFIIVVDLREDNTKSILHYWHSFCQHQQFYGEQKPSLIVVGSHLDVVNKDIVEARMSEFRTFCDDSVEAGLVHMSSYFMLDCCKPKSKQIADIQALVCSITKDSPRFELSHQASVLLGLLEKDFTSVPACSVQDLLAHIEETGLPPFTLQSLYPVLHELHDLGLLFIVDSSKAGILAPQVVLNISQLTNIVHKSLFSEDANLKQRLKEICGGEGYHFNVGIIPEHVLKEILPQNITKEFLVQLQYCQEISHKDVNVFPYLQSFDSTEQSFLFFPALCSADKRDVAWVTPPDLSYGIGWLARCTDPRDYFPPRFLHVLLLRLVFNFTLSVPQQALSGSPDHSYFQHRCTMWKTGVHWLMIEGVECMVELASANKEVVVLCNCEQEAVENCTSVFNSIISCVMEAKAEFCHSVNPQFFLLESTEEAGYLCEDNIFAMSDVEEALICPDKHKVVVSVNGKRWMKLEKVLHFAKFTHWYSLFPIDFATVLDYLKDIVKELYMLGLHLGVSRGILEALEADFPTDTSRRMRELVRGWMSSSLDPPCWWQLVQALREVQNRALAKEIKAKHSIHVLLQEKLLDRQNHSLQPDVEFLESFAGVMGSKWPSLAACLFLRESEIEEVKSEGLSQQDRAFKMLKKWISRKDATYGQLFERLKTISLFQYSQKLTN